MKPLIVIAGPTACRKTEISIELAKRINGEIISADSMQIYKYMDIGTAKPTVDEMKGVRHYLIDELEPDEEYSVAIFSNMAKRYSAEILSHSNIPILVGGTGFYINAFVNETSFFETEADLEFRERMYSLANERGNTYVYELLKNIDPEACEKIHANNLKRVIRALEFNLQTGMKISDHNRSEKQKTGSYNVVFIVLYMPRDKLYNRIEQRIDHMLKRGLLDEVENLLVRGYDPGLVSMQGLGYKEMMSYIQGAVTLEAAVETLKRNTRRFAKRQITWFKNQHRGLWINIDEIDNIGIIVDDIMHFAKIQFEGSNFYG